MLPPIGRRRLLKYAAAGLSLTAMPAVAAAQTAVQRPPKQTSPDEFTVSTPVSIDVNARPLPSFDTRDRSRVRFGEPVHVFNNYYLHNTDVGVACQANAGCLVEGNYFEDVEEPVTNNYAGPSGRCVARNNVFFSRPSAGCIGSSRSRLCSAARRKLLLERFSLETWKMRPKLWSRRSEDRIFRA